MGTALEEPVRSAVGDIESVPDRAAEHRARASRPRTLSVVIIDGTGDHRHAPSRSPRTSTTVGPTSPSCSTPSLGSDVVARAMQAGVRDVLGAGADDDRIREAVKRALEVADAPYRPRRSAEDEPRTA